MAKKKGRGSTTSSRRGRARPEPPVTAHKARVEAYVADVLSGRRVVGKLERYAVERHVRDLKTAKRRGFVFDERLAARACDFFLRLRHTGGEWKGRPFVLQGVQLFIVWSLFGWRRTKTGLRRFRRAIVSMARGGGKTAFAAGLSLLLAGFDEPVEWRAEAYNVGPDKEIARRCFADVAAFVGDNQQLSGLVKVYKNAIEFPRTGAYLKPLSGLGKNKDSLRPHLIVCDEVHAWRAEHKDLWEKLTTALGKLRQPLLLVITTAGDDESELWDSIYEIAVDVVTPGVPFELDDWFVLICQLDEEDDPLDEANWPKANPLLAEGLVKIDDLRSEAKVARQRPEERNKFIRYKCNRKVSSTQRLITRELWARGAGPLPDLTDAPCRGGFDWGWKDDLAALALAFPLESVEVGGELRRRFAIAVDCWIPQGTKRNLAEEPWASWIAAGWLRVTPGEQTDTAAIYQRIEELRERHSIQTIAMDPNNCREFGSRIQTAYGIEAFYFGQNHGKYNEPTRELLGALRDGRIVHGDNPLLAWSACNVLASTDGRDYLKPEKKRSRDKIDPFCAVVMALSECLFAPAPEPSYYEHNDFEAG